MTEITTSLDPDNEYQKTLVVGPRLDIDQWISTLSLEKQNAWNTAKKYHADVCAVARENGDQVIENLGGGNTLIKWKSPEVHDEYMQKIPPDQNQIYMDFWAEYLKFINSK